MKLILLQNNDKYRTLFLFDIVFNVKRVSLCQINKRITIFVIVLNINIQDQIMGGTRRIGSRCEAPRGIYFACLYECSETSCFISKDLNFNKVLHEQRNVDRWQTLDTLFSDHRYADI